MEPYYSSDEEIAWGPLSLREIKGDLKRQVRKLNRRRTVHCSFKDCHKMEASLDKDLDKLDISEASTTYLTPNESLQTNSNNNFLEKLSEVINLPSSELSEYGSVLEHTEVPDSQTEDSSHQKSISLKMIPEIIVTEPDQNESCMNFIKVLENRETNYDIENFQQSLVENTCILSDDEEEYDDDSLIESAEVVNADEKKSVPEEGVIIISDDSDSDSSVISNNPDCINCVEENISVSVKNEVDSDDCKEQHNDNGSENDSSLYENSFEEDVVQLDLKNNSDNIFTNSAKTSSKESSQYKCNENFCMSPNMQHKLSMIKESLSTSPVVLPEIDYAQFDESMSQDESFQLNDTVEEMKRAVCQGLNYSMSDDEIVENTPVKPEYVPSKTALHYKETVEHTPHHNEEMRSRLPKPISTDKKQIKKFSPQTNFKVPESKKLKPTPTKSCPSHLKNIVSPVALYIKNSPRFPLRQNVPQKELFNVTTSVTTKICNKENFPEFPEVVYKPAKSQIAANERHIVIPSYMKKLNVKEGQITKHEGRLHHELNRSKVSKKLLQTDITNCAIDQSLLSDAGDISVLTNKQAFIK